MKKFLSLYWMSVDYGLKQLATLIANPFLRLFSNISPAFRERANANDYQSSGNPNQRTNSARTDSLAFALPGISLFSLVMILGALFDVPMKIYHLVILLALIIAGVYACIVTVMKNKDSHKQEFQQMSYTQRRKWVMLSSLFVLMCIILPFIMLVV
ncbi:MAG: hypothetical protein II905_02965 [Muribaculaceae bacterium]|nr:hypothetical protein [Muribaculaceae bacterium]